MKQLLIIVLILISTMLFAQTDDPHRLSHKVEPIYQLIHLNLDPDKEKYSGHTSIELEIKENMTSFRLHGKEFEISDLELKHDKKSHPVTYKFQEHGLLQIISKHELSTGNYNLSFRFNGHYDKKGQGYNYGECFLCANLIFIAAGKRITYAFRYNKFAAVNFCF